MTDRELGIVAEALGIEPGLLRKTLTILKMRYQVMPQKGFRKFATVPNILPGPNFTYPEQQQHLMAEELTVREYKPGDLARLF